MDPSQVRAGSNLGVLATSTDRDGLGADSFSGLEKRLGKPLTLIWIQVARLQPTTKEPEVIVRVYRVGESARGLLKD